MAECHPVGFQWVMEAKARGATIIHIDPRFTRTSALADIHVPIRAGSDIAFLGALVNHIISEGKDFREYVVAYTNAASLVSEDFRDTEDLAGVFSGFDPGGCSYDPSSWQYEGFEGSVGGEHAEAREKAGTHVHGSHGAALDSAHPPRDETLQHPRCVYQVLRRHFARYTPEMVERVCGVPPDLFAKVCAAWTQNSGRQRTTALVYSVGWTQHTTGVQCIRAGSIVQLLLGNIGRPGGGVMALRGHASIQGSTDVSTLFNLLPGYLPMPDPDHHRDFASYVDAIRGTGQKGFWGHADAYAASFLKAYWG